MSKALRFATSVLSVTVALTLSSCSKGDLASSLLAGQTFDAPSTDFTIPVINGVHQSFISLDSVKLDLDINELIRGSTDGAAGIDDADKIVIKSLKMHLTDADASNNWANLDTVNIFLSSNTSNGPTKLATVTNTDKYSDLVQGNINASVNAKDYLKGNQIFYIFYGTNRRATTKVLHGKIDVQFTVE